MKIKAILLTSFYLLLLLAPLFTQRIDMAAVNSADNFRWGVYAFHRSYYNEAIRSLELALGFKPQDKRTKSWMGRVLYKSGFEEAALNEWNTILDSGTNDPLLSNLVQVLSLRRGINKEIDEEERLVVTRVLDAGNNTYYQFKRPTSVKPRKNGAFFVVAYGSNEVLSINANSIVTDIFKGGFALFDHPFDVLEREDGTFFVSEYEGDKISLCKANGDKSRVFGKKGAGEGELLGPQYLAMDSKGYLYVTDWGNKRVSKFDTEGNFILSFGNKKPGESIDTASVLAAPTGISILNDMIFVADKIKKQIAVYDQSGNYLSALGAGELWGPEGISVKNSNTLLIADTLGFGEKTRVLEIEIEQEKISPIPGVIDKSKRILSAAMDANRNLIAVDFDMNKIFILSRISDLYSGYFVEIQSIKSVNFPEVTVDIAVQDRYGNPVYGLEKQNFVLTEPERAVSGITMYNPVTIQENTELILLVEKSVEMEKRKADLKIAVEGILRVSGTANVTVVSAGETGEIEISNATGIMEISNKATEGKYTKNWNFDAGLRLGASRLLASRFRRAIIYLSCGGLGIKPFSQYSLLELKQFLKNNYINFTLINLGAEKPAETLLFLCNETNGDYYSFYSPEGILPVIPNIKKKPDPRYILKYQSHTFPDFGNRYIELNVEVIANKISGKDVLGYYSPLK